MTDFLNFLLEIEDDFNNERFISFDLKMKILEDYTRS